jgi:ComF family protein
MQLDRRQHRGVSTVFKQQTDGFSRRRDKLLSAAGRWSGSVAALAVPPRCVVCGDGTLPQARVCDLCRSLLDRLPHGTLMRATRKHFADGCFAAYPYEGPARELVQALKFRGAAAAAREMAALVVARVPVGLLNGAALVPVPAHPARHRERGFNQAALLANEISAICELPVLDMLVRDRARPPQSTLSREERLKLPERSVSVKPEVRGVEKRPITEISLGSSPTKVVLVDDVTTTGVTLEVCASAIRERYPTGLSIQQPADRMAHRQSADVQMQFEDLKIGALAFASTSAHPAQMKGSLYKG